MADSLQDFFVSFGFKLDKDSERKAIEDAGKTQDKLTAIADRGGVERMTAAEYRAMMQAEREKAIAEQAAADAAKIRGKRDKVETDAGAKRNKVEDEAAKKERDRRAANLKDFEKHLVGIETVAGRVAGVVGTIGTAFLDTAIVRNIASVASAYSQLETQSQRTRSAPGAIQSVMFALKQMGVGDGEAQSSFEGFTKALRTNPGMRGALAKAGINMNQDPAKIFAEMGKYFNTLPYQVALPRAASWGIGENALNALEKQAELQKHMGDFDAKNKTFGFDPNQAAKDGRAFTAALDNLTTDLSTIKDKIEAQFFKPMTEGFDKLSAWMEQHPDLTVKLGEGLVAFAGLMSLRVIPVLLRLTGAMSILTALTPPAWLLAALGVANAGLAAPYVAEHGITSIDPATAQPLDANPMGALGPRPGEEGAIHRAWRRRPKWMGGEGRYGAGAKLGKRLEMDGDLHSGPGVSGVSINTKLSDLSDDQQDQLISALAKSEGNPGARSDYNNPGNMKYGPFAATHGATGPGMLGIAKFPDAETGRNAAKALVFGKNYRDLTILEMANKYSPRGDGANDPDSKAAFLAKGISSAASRPVAVANATAPSPGNKALKLPPGAVAWGEDANHNPVPISADGHSMNWHGGLAKVAPLGDTPELRASIMNSNTVRGHSTFNQNVTVNGVQNPNEVADAVRANAGRGSKDWIRNMEGSSH